MLVKMLKNFWWEKGEASWVRSMVGKSRALSVALGVDRGGGYLAVTGRTHEVRRRIYIPNDMEAAGWWKFLEAIGVLMGRKLVPS